MNAKIHILGWHGAVSPTLGVKMNEIATPTSEGCHYSWDFNGTLAEFVSKWDLPFLVLPQIPDKELGTKLRRKPSDPPAVEWAVFISDHPSFQTR